MNDRELMQMALDALIETVRLAGEYGTHLIRNDKDAGHAYETIEALRARLAQPEPEPVAWWHDRGDFVDLNVSGHGTPLYFAPPQREWQGLTDQEQLEIMKQFGPGQRGLFADAIEAKLKEKNA